MSSIRRSFSGNRLGAEIIGPHRIDETERTAFLARAVIGQHQDQGVVANARCLQERDQPCQMAVGVVEHAGKCRLQPREHPLFVRAVFIPRLHAVIARGHFGVRRHQPHRLLPRQALLALDVPAMGKNLIIAFDDIGRRLMRRVAGAKCEPGQERQIRPVGDVIGNKADPTGRPDRPSNDSRWRKSPGGLIWVLSETSSGAY